MIYGNAPELTTKTEMEMEILTKGLSPKTQSFSGLPNGDIRLNL